MAELLLILVVIKHEIQDTHRIDRIEAEVLIPPLRLLLNGKRRVEHAPVLKIILLGLL